MPRFTGRRISMKQRVLLAVGLSFGVLMVYAQVRQQGTPRADSAVTEPTAPMQRKYLWRAANGTVLAAVDSNPATTELPAFEGRADFVATPSKAVAPITSRGANRRVFDFRRRVRTEVPISAGNAPPVTDFLIGETHLGMSQLRVAQIFTQLLRAHEIDAVFVEQPDDLTYDWTPFASLQPTAAQAIAALQFRLINDSRADLAPFQPIIKELAAQNLGDDAMVAALERRLGRDRFNAFEQALEASDRYEKSEYLSAMDYMYATLQLQGMTIPFHNMESRSLRQAFHAAMANARSADDLRPHLPPRDEYMLQKARSTISAKGYRQVVWIVGALHLQNLRELLTAEGHTVHIAYDSLRGEASPGDLKNDMMLFVKKDAFLRAAKASVPSSFTVDSGMLPGPGPSDELTQAVIRGVDSFDSSGIGALSAKDREALPTRFAQQFARQHPRGQTTWQVAFTLDDAGVIEVSKSPKGTLSLSRQESLTVADDNALRPLSKGYVVVNTALGERLQKLNAMQRHSAVFTVVDQGSSYAAYADAEPFYRDDDNNADADKNDPSALIDAINERLRSSKKTAVYIDLVGFSEERADSFESTCRLRQKVLNNHHNLEMLKRPDVPIANRDALFAPGRLDRSVSPTFDTINQGPLKGFVRMTLQFLANVGGTIVKVTVFVFGPSVDVLREMYAMLGASDSSMSIADAVAQAKSELKKRHGLSDDKLRVRLREEFGKTIISERLEPTEGLWSWRS